ncbi:unnamed protein product [Acanthoscelides obtectus]|uniref:Uncharacterized protein n=1 Tax=Acanthoscelides obtectus TaxID=200917 RepID=A0A9P0PBS2_ACAOB|nr:unnamed protein product [Acanthoscelides obtectus]CAK1637736.1 hypothetical protein AOBTE_LOCUS10165 [Acanthoscelides obtectus]
MFAEEATRREALPLTRDRCQKANTTERNLERTSFDSLFWVEYFSTVQRIAVYSWYIFEEAGTILDLRMFL